MDAAEKKRLLLERLRSGAIQITRPEEAIPRLPPGEFVPLSRAQKRIAFVQELYPEGCFNGSLAISHDGDLDLERLRKCLTLVVGRHDVLRTSAVRRPQGIVGRVNAPTQLDCDYLDLSEQPAETRRDQAIAYGRRFVGRPFDIFRDSPLIRAAVVRLDPGASVIVLAMHMFVFDAPSGILFAAELATLYSSAGEPVPATAAAYQYADYVAWEDARRGSDHGALEYWVDRLAASEAELQLPTETARSGTPTFAALRHPFAVPRELEDALKALGRRHGATFYIVILTALKIVLHRHALAQSISVGAWTVRRNSRNAHLLGPFVNTLVYRTSFAPEDTLADALLKVKRQALAAYSHADLPFEEVVAALNPVRDPNLNPLFQVHFILQETSSQQKVGKFSLSDLDAVIGASGGYDIELIVRDLQRGVEGHVEANAQLFDQEQVARFADRFLAVLRAMADDERQSLANLPLGHAAGALPRTPESPRDLAAILDGFLHADPESTAICDGAMEVSYRTLRTLMSRLEAWLSTQSADALVVVAGPAGVLLCAAMMSALRLGRPFMSVGAVPDAATRTFLAGQAELVVISSDRPPPGLQDRPCWPGPEIGTGRSPPSAELARAVPSHRPAYVAKTSGSTGAPGIVAISREGLATLIDGVCDAYGLDQASRILQTAESRFDVAIEEIVPTLCVGGCIVVSGHRAGGLDAIAEATAGWRVTHLNLTSSLWESWLHHLRRTGQALPRTLHTVVIGSEPVDLSAVKAWRSGFGDSIRLINAYGCAEAAITSALYEVPARDALDALALLPIGHALPGASLDVVDCAGVSLPDAVIGEIVLGGPGVADGYLAQTGLAERFVERGGERWFRTGDLGRRRRDGAVELLGRRDRRVKVRGQFADLEQVEAALSRHAKVTTCTVALDRKQVVARIWSSPPSANTEREIASDLEAELRVALATALPGAVVDRFEIVGASRGPLPLNEGVTDPMLERLAALWRDVAKVQVTGEDEDLFDLGATSLACLDVVSAAQCAGLALSVVDVYRCRTLREQAALLTSTRADT